MHIHRYEKIWLTFGGITLIAFIIILAFNTYAMGMVPPSGMQMIDPTKVSQTPPFDKPGLYKVGPNEYNAIMTAFIFGYEPSLLEIPVGSTVHFQVTSKDVVHGFEIPGTNVNMMVLPGHVNTATHTFATRGQFLILCNEYCGTGHQMMAIKIVVK